MPHVMAKMPLQGDTPGTQAQTTHMEGSQGAYMAPQVAQGHASLKDMRTLQRHRPLSTAICHRESHSKGSQAGARPLRSLECMRTLQRHRLLSTAICHRECTGNALKRQSSSAGSSSACAHSSTATCCQQPSAEVIAAPPLRANSHLPKSISRCLPTPAPPAKEKKGEQA